MFDRRSLLTRGLALGVAGLLVMGSAPVFAQDAPQLQMFVPAAPGGGWDQTARTMEQVLRGEGLISGAQITNVGGAGGTVGLPQFVNRYEGEPNTLMVSGMVMVGSIIANRSPVSLDQVTPIARLTGEFEALVVPAASPFQTVDDFVAALKADPTAVPVTGGSAGGSDHILFGLIAQSAGVPATSLSYVPYAGGGEALAALLGNQVAAGISGYGEFAEQVKAGSLRVLAISADERQEGIDAPTLKESGVDVELFNWRGVWAPPEVSAEDEAAMVKLVETMATSEAWKTEAANRGWSEILLTGDDFDKFLAEENARIEGILKELGLAS
jgi:putative tricarboxylic transport membrane protein